jgi:hypothetical protein
MRLATAEFSFAECGLAHGAGQAPNRVAEKGDQIVHRILHTFLWERTAWKSVFACEGSRGHQAQGRIVPSVYGRMSSVCATFDRAEGRHVARQLKTHRPSRRLMNRPDATAPAKVRRRDWGLIGINDGQTHCQMADVAPKKLFYGWKIRSLILKETESCSAALSTLWFFAFRPRQLPHTRRASCPGAVPVKVTP